MLHLRISFPVTLAATALACSLIGCNRSPQAREKRFLERAEKLASQKDYARALLETRNAAIVMPKDAEPYYRMALLELQTNQANAAVRDLGKALQLNAGHQQARLKLSELMALNGNRQVVEGAEKELHEVLAASPGNLEAIDTLAFTQWRLGKPDDAAKMLEETLAKVPARLQTSVALARVKMSRNDLAGAEQVLVAAVAAAPESAAAALALSRFYLMIKKHELAEEQARKAVQLDSRNGLALLTLGNLEAEKGRKDQAEETYKRLAQLPDPRYRSIHAIFLFEIGRRQEAIMELVKLHKATPDDRALRGYLVAAYQANGQGAEARAVVEDALKHNPKDVEALLIRGNGYLQEGKPKEAERDLQAALHYRGDSIPAHFALAQLYQRTGRSLSARQQLQEVLRLKPDMLQARLALARILTLASEPEGAIGLLNEAPAAQRNLPASIVERNWALKAKNDWPAFRRSVEEGLKLGRTPDLVFQDGLAKLNAGDFAGARTDAQEVLKLRAEDFGAAGMLAASYAGQKQTQKAVEALREIVEAHPKSAPLQKLYGDWLRSDGKSGPAREAYRAATALDPKYLEADFAIVGMDVADKQMDTARKTLSSMLEKSQGNPKILLLLGSLETDPTVAMSRYRAVLETEPKNAVALNNLAYLMANTDPDGALPYAQQAVEIAPDSAMIQDTIGWIYYRKGAYGTAVRYLETAVSKEPNPRRQFHLALTYIKHGNERQGRALLATALAKDPQLTKSEVGW